MGATSPRSTPTARRPTGSTTPSPSRSRAVRLPRRPGCASSWRPGVARRSVSTRCRDLMDELKALRSLATELGVHTRYTDGLGKRITVVPETLVRVCAALGAPITRVSDASRALHAHRAAKAAQPLPPVVEIGRASCRERVEVREDDEA